ncbi:MAG: hypothetical protein R2838_06735 [Caldilineaceae bacterium]
MQWTDEAYLRFGAPRVTPIYVEAMGPKMLHRSGPSGRRCAALLFPPEHYFNVRPLVAAGEAEQRSVFAAAGLRRDASGFHCRKIDRAARRVLAQRRSPTTARRWVP